MSSSYPSIRCGPDYHSHHASMDGRRIKSIITFAEESKDEFKEGIQEHTCRRCDSSEEFIIKETCSHPIHIDEAPANNLEKSSLGCSSFVDLESCLRERALENLRKFKQGVEKNEPPLKFKSSDFHYDNNSEQHSITSMGMAANLTPVLRSEIHSPCQSSHEHGEISTSEVDVGEQVPLIERFSAEKSVGNGGVLGGDGEEEASQFEHKTISVMRGGEMVQVSYKVYIPKKAPALPRRQLQR